MTCVYCTARSISENLNAWVASARAMASSSGTLDPPPGPQRRTRPTCRASLYAGPGLAAFLNLDYAPIAIYDHPIAGLDQVQRIAVEIGHARHPHDHGSERDLRRHLVED